MGEISLKYAIKFLSGSEPPVPVPEPEPEFINAVPTGDIITTTIFVIVALLCLASITAFLFYWNRVKNSAHVSSNLAGKFSSYESQDTSKFKRTKTIAIVSIALLLLISLFSGIKSFAFANSNSNDDTTIINAYVNEETGEITFDDVIFKNPIDEKLVINNSSVAVMQESQDVTGIYQSEFMISGLDATLFQGNPDGKKFIVDHNVRPLEIGESTVLSFDMSNLSIDSARALIGRDVFMINFGTWEQTPNLRFDASPGEFDDGSSFIDVEQTVYKNYVIPAKEPNREHYEFAGWFSQTEGKGIKIDSSKTYEDISIDTAYAYWTPIQYSVTSTIQTGQAGWGTIENTCPETIPYGTTISASNNVITIEGYGTITANPNSKTSQFTYGFLSWTNASKTYVDGDIEFCANFTRTNNIYKLTLDNESTTQQGSDAIYLKYNDGYYLDEACTKKMTANTNAISIPLRNGYNFTGYSYANVQFITPNGYLVQNASTILFDFDATFNASWFARPDTKYYVNHYKQNIDGSYPSIPTYTQEFQGTTDTAVTPDTMSTEEGQDFYGFTAPSTTQLTIAGDGLAYVDYKYTRNTYAVNFLNTPESIPTQYVKYEDKVTRPDNPNKTGYKFINWFKDQSHISVWDFDNDAVSKATNIYADWNAKTYTIVSDKNGGEYIDSSPVISQTYTYDGEPLQTSTFTKPRLKGYSMTKWITELSKDEIVTIDNNNLALVGCNVDDESQQGKIIANWEVKSYTVQLDSQGADISQGTTSFNIQYGADLPSSITPPQRLYAEFLGYFGSISDPTSIQYFDKDGKSTVEKWWVDQEDPVLYARWHMLGDTEYTVYHYKANIDGTYPDNPTDTQTAMGFDNDQITPETMKTDEGYDYYGFVAPSKQTITIHKDQTNVVKYYYERKKFNVTFVTNISGQSPIVKQVVYGNKAQEEQLTYTGYTNDGWYKNSSFTQAWNFASDIVTSDVTIYAKWNANKYTIVADPGPGNYDGQQSPVIKLIYTYDSDPVITSSLSTPSYLGYTFDKWLSNDKSKQILTINKNNLADVGCDVSNPEVEGSVKANYNANSYTVKFNANGAQTGSVEDQVFVYDQKQNLHKNNFEKVGFEFAGWVTDTTHTVADYIDKEEVQNLATSQGAIVNLYAFWQKLPVDYTIKYYRQNIYNDDPATEPFNTEVKQAPAESYVTVSADAMTGFETPSDKDDVFIKADGTTVVEFVYLRIKYNVTFDLQGHGENIPDSVKYESTVNKPSDPTDKGYTFNGWYKEAACSTEWNFESDTVLDTTTIYAKWTANQYVIDADANGGSFGESDTKSLTYTYNGQGVNTSSLSRPTKTGYTFVGWYTLREGGSKAEYIDNTNLSAVGCDVNNPTIHGRVYAHWTANKYLIRADAEGGEYEQTSPIKTIEYTYDSPEISTEDVLTRPSKTGYTFASWYSQPGSDGSKIEKINNDTLVSVGCDLTDPDKEGHLYAHWTAKTYTVKLNWMYEETPETPKVEYITATYGNTMPNITVPIRQGWQFDGFFIDQEFSGETFYNADGTSTKVWDIDESGIELFAKWTNVPFLHYTVWHIKQAVDETYPSYDPEELEAWPSDLKHKEVLTIDVPGGEVTPSIYDGFGEYFISPETQTVNVTEDYATTVVYRYGREVCTLWSVDDPDKPSQHTKRGEYKYEQKPTKPSEDPVKPGYLFVGWYYENYTKQWDWDYDIMTAKDIVIYAKYELATYTINADPDGGSFTGESPVTKLNYTYNAAPVTIASVISEPSKPGFTFGGWLDKDGNEITQIYSSNLEKCSINLSDPDNPGEITAKWIENQYTVEFNPNSGSGTAMPDQTFSYTESKSLSKNTYTRSGYHFIGWAKDPTATVIDYGDQQVVSKLTTESTIILYAIWEGNTYTINANPDPGAFPPDPEPITKIEYVYGTTKPIDFTDPERTGYNFAGWYTSGESPVKIEVITKDNLASTGCVLDDPSVEGGLSAHWTAKTTTINFVCLEDEDQNFQRTATFDEPLPDITESIPSVSGKVFDGYFDNSLITPEAYYDKNGYPLKEKWDVNSGEYTLTAKFVTGYQIIYKNKNDEDFPIELPEGSPTIYYPGQESILPNLFEEGKPSEKRMWPGYIFKGWHFDSSCMDDVIDKIEASFHVTGQSVTVYADWDGVKSKIQLYDEPSNKYKPDPITVDTLYHKCGDPNLYSDIACESDQVVTKITPPTSENWEFLNYLTTNGEEDYAFVLTDGTIQGHKDIFPVEYKADDEDTAYTIYANYDPGILELKAYYIDKTDDISTHKPILNVPTIYQKYGIGWFSDDECTNQIYDLQSTFKNAEVPVQNNYNFIGLYDGLTKDTVNIANTETDEYGRYKFAFIDEEDTYKKQSGIYTALYEGKIYPINLVKELEPWRTIYLKYDDGIYDNEACLTKIEQIEPPDMQYGTYTGFENGLGQQLINDQGVLSIDNKYLNDSNYLDENYSTLTATAQWSSKIYRITYKFGSGSSDYANFYERFGVGFYKDEACTEKIDSIKDLPSPYYLDEADKKGYNQLIGLYQENGDKALVVNGKNVGTTSDDEYKIVVKPTLEPEFYSAPVYLEPKYIHDYKFDITLKSRVPYQTERTIGTIYEIIYYNTQGFYTDSGRTNKITATSSYIAPVPTDTSNEYIFDGYYTEQYGRGKKYFDSDGHLASGAKPDLFEEVASSTIILHAYWKPRDFTIHFDNGANVAKEYQTEIFGRVKSQYDTRFLQGFYRDNSFSEDAFMKTDRNPISPPEKIGYKFGGYYYGDYQVIDERGYVTNDDWTWAFKHNYTIHAKWIPNDLIISFYDDDREVVPSQIHVMYGEKIGDMPIPAKQGYVFKGWWTRDLSSGAYVREYTSEDTVDFLSDINLFAKWENATYKIKAMPYPGEFVDDDPIDEITFTYGGNPINVDNTISSVAKDGWFFKYWGNNNSESAFEIHEINNDTIGKVCDINNTDKCGYLYAIMVPYEYITIKLTYSVDNQESVNHLYRKLPTNEYYSDEDYTQQVTIDSSNRVEIPYSSKDEFMGYYYIEYDGQIEKNRVQIIDKFGNLTTNADTLSKTRTTLYGVWNSDVHPFYEVQLNHEGSYNECSDSIYLSYDDCYYLDAQKTIKYDNVNRITTPQKANCTFEGYYYKDSSDNEIMLINKDGCLQPDQTKIVDVIGTKDIVAYAKWTGGDINVHFYDADIIGDNPRIYEHSKPFGSFPEISIDEEWEESFEYWYIKDQAGQEMRIDENTIVDSPDKSDLNVYAKMKLKFVELNYQKGAEDETLLGCVYYNLKHNQFRLDPNDEKTQMTNTTNPIEIPEIDETCNFNGVMFDYKSLYEGELLIDKNGFLLENWMTNPLPSIALDRVYAAHDGNVFAIKIMNEENELKKTIYEKYSVGFYNDAECTIPVDKDEQLIDIPQSEQENLEFCGYYLYNDLDNEIIINYYGKINEDLPPDVVKNDSLELEPKFADTTNKLMTINIHDLIGDDSQTIYQVWHDAFYADDFISEYNKITRDNHHIAIHEVDGYYVSGICYVINGHEYTFFEKAAESTGCEYYRISDKAFNNPCFYNESKEIDLYVMREHNDYTHFWCLPFADSLMFWEKYAEYFYCKSGQSKIPITKDAIPDEWHSNVDGLINQQYDKDNKSKLIVGWVYPDREDQGLMLTKFGYIGPNWSPDIIKYRIELEPVYINKDVTNFNSINITTNVACDIEGTTKIYLESLVDDPGYYLDENKTQKITNDSNQITPHQKSHYHTTGYYSNDFSYYHKCLPLVFTEDGYLCPENWESSEEFPNLEFDYYTLFGPINDGITQVLEPDTYQINYLDGGSETEFSGRFTEDYPTTHIYDSDTNLVSPTRQGFKFDGWYLDKECTSSPVVNIDASMYSENGKINVYAKWTVTGEFLTLKLDPTDGTLGMYKQIYQRTGDAFYRTSTSAIPMTPSDMGIDTPTADSLNFVGYYYYDDEGTAHKIINNDGYLCEGVEPILTLKPGESEITLFAAWDGAKFKITLDSHGGSGGASEIYCKYAEGYYSDEECLNKITSIDQLPTKSGYVFGGYLNKNTMSQKHQRLCDSKGVLENTYTAFSKTNSTAYANYVKSSYRLYLNAGFNDCHLGTSLIYEVLDEGLYFDSTFHQPIYKIDVPYKNGYIFEGYYAYSNYAEVCVINADGTVNENFKSGLYSTSDYFTLTAKWSIIDPVTINIDSLRSSHTSTTHLYWESETSTTFEVPANVTRWEILYERSKDNINTTINFIVGTEIVKSVKVVSDNPSHTYIDNWTVADCGNIAASESTVNMDPIFYGRLYTYTMAELQAVSDELSSKGEDSSYWTEFNFYVDNAFHYTLDSNGNKIYDGADNGIPFTDYNNNIINPNANNLWSIDWYRRTYTENNYKGYDYDADYTSNYNYSMTFRIVGINQEVENSIASPKGITMMATRGWRQGYDKDNYGAPWFKQSSQTETWINWDSATIQKTLTELTNRQYLEGFPFIDAKNNLNPVSKTYFKFNSTQTKPETPINFLASSYAWIPSVDELVGSNNGGVFDFDIKEGVGESHNEQYQAFARAGYSANTNSKILANVLRGGAAEGIHGMWTRTKVPLVKQAYSLHPAGMYDNNVFVPTDYVSSDQAILICFNI